MRGGGGRGLLCCSLAVIAIGLLTPLALAQDPHRPVPSTDWRLVLDGEPIAWPLAPDLPVDSLHAAAWGLREALARDGYPFATLDSVVVERNRQTLYASSGMALAVASVEIEGGTGLGADDVLDLLYTRPGRPLDPDRLAEDLHLLLQAYERSGFPLAQAELATVEQRDDGWHLTLRVVEGPPLRLRGVELTTQRPTDPAFAARLAGLTPGAPLAPYAPEAIRSELTATGLFESVGTPEIVLETDGWATLRVPVEEGPPGAFDLMLGYLPPTLPGESGALVGSGSLALRNLFGRGRRLSLALVRQPDLVSSIDVRAADPFVLGLPLRLEGRFAGYQQDTTFSRQWLEGEAGYRVAPGLEVFGTVRREGVEAGLAGSVLVDGRPIVADGRAWFAGVGARFTQVDRPFAPRRGVTVGTRFERGTKRRVLPESAVEPVSVRQQRLEADARVFVPLGRRPSLVLGGDAAVLLSPAYDDADLFRFGGAATLRGYEEERFRGNAVARALVEGRYLLDASSFAFTFFDLGYVNRPETPGVPATARWAPGYGLGLQYRTPLGLVTASYALNPEDGPTQGKVHVSLSVGL